MQAHPAQAVQAGKLPLPWWRDLRVHHKLILRINLKIEFTTSWALNLTRHISAAAAAAAAAAALQPPRSSHASEFAFGARPYCCPRSLAPGALVSNCAASKSSAPIGMEQQRM